MGFVVEEVPFGSVVVCNRSFPIISVGKSFGSSAQEWMFLDEIEGACPDDFADVARFRATILEDCSRCRGRTCEGNFVVAYKSL